MKKIELNTQAKFSVRKYLKSQKYKNGLELLTVYLNKRLAVIEDMPKEDRAKIEASVSAYLELHKPDLEKKISLHVPLSASNEEVAKEGKIIFENLEKFQEIVLNMSEDISTQIREKK